MNRRLLLVGAGGHGKVVLDAALCMSRYQEIVFLDDDDSIREVMGYPVVGTCDQIPNYIRDTDFFVTIGDVKYRKKFYEEIKALGGNVTALIHPDAVIARDVRIGEGTVVMAGVVINSGTTVGRCCVINTSSSVDHDCRIADYVHISVGAHVAGTVKIGSGTWIGAGAVVSNNLSICEQCTLGAGAVAVKDIAEPGIYVGVPAREKDSEPREYRPGGRARV